MASRFTECEFSALWSTHNSIMLTGRRVMRAQDAVVGHAQKALGVCAYILFGSENCPRPNDLGAAQAAVVAPARDNVVDINGKEERSAGTKGDLQRKASAPVAARPGRGRGKSAAQVAGSKHRQPSIAEALAAARRRAAPPIAGGVSEQAISQAFESSLAAPPVEEMEVDKLGALLHHHFVFLSALLGNVVSRPTALVDKRRALRCWKVRGVTLADWRRGMHKRTAHNVCSAGRAGDARRDARQVRVPRVGDNLSGVARAGADAAGV